MSLALLVYLISTLKGVGIVSVVVLCFSILAFLAFTVGRNDDTNSDYRQLNKEEKKAYNDEHNTAATRSFFVAVFAVLMIVFVPNERDAYIITGAYMAQKIYESPETAKLQGKVLTILNNKLDGYIQEQTAASK